jgi:MiaB/RimO family radical SAM methylthiotransferase
LVLTGIFLGAYGHPTALRRRRLADMTAHEPLRPPPGLSGSPLAALTDALCTGVPGLKRLRFSSLEPGDLDADLIAALSGQRQVVPHFHLPLQSGSNELLRRMNRQYTREAFLDMVDRVRDAFDRPALTTDIIVGFPGETDAEFERTLEVAGHCRFIHIHAFPFSPRPGTAAARWTARRVPGAIVNERIERLRELSEGYSLEFRGQFIGEIAEVLVERGKGDGVAADSTTTDSSACRRGRGERYFPVEFNDSSARPGDFMRVKIDRLDGEKTFGTVV